MSLFAAVVVLAVLAAFASPAPSLASKSPPLAREAFVVVAVVDSGINPYHVDFRRPDLTVHPSTYVEGFPTDIPALRLTLSAKTYKEARDADQVTWLTAKENRLYWIPGTNIIGAIGPFDNYDLGGGVDPPILDSIGHGTAVSSLAGGLIHGPHSTRILVVSVQGFNEGLAWAVRQPWIDVITNSLARRRLLG